MVVSSGPWCSCSPSQSRHSLRGGGTTRAGLREGKFSLRVCDGADSLLTFAVNSAERFDFLPTTQVGTGQVQVQVFWIRWPPCPGSSLDWGALHSNMCPRDWISLLWDTDLGAATETCLSTRTRRYCGSRTRSERESEPYRGGLDRQFDNHGICIFCSLSFFLPCRIGIEH